MEKQVNFEEVVKSLEDETIATDLIQDNKLPFVCDGKFYRIRMPNQNEVYKSREIYNARYIELVQKDNTLLKKDLIRVLKEKKIVDIEKLQNDLEELNKELLQVEISLSTKKDAEKEAIQKFKNKKAEIRQKKLALINEISNHLAPAIENQAQDKQYAFLAAICAEKYIEKDDKKEWVSVWKSFEEWKKDDSKLSYVAVGKVAEITFIL